jgi:mannose-6-phosphate isomerase-like protein (cupin superfamily)
MATFNKDMTKLASGNKDFQREVFLDKNIQIVLMSLLPGEDIGEETHRADQTTYFVEGTGQAIIDNSRVKVGPNHMIVIPQGAKHNIVNKGDTPLKLFSVYSPPAEEPGVRHRTKAEAEAAEEGVVSKAVKVVTKAAGDLKKKVVRAKD